MVGLSPLQPPLGLMDDHVYGSHGCLAGGHSSVFSDSQRAISSLQQGLFALGMQNTFLF